MAITIIIGKPRVGKTALMTNFLCNEAFNQERITACKNEIKTLNMGGFDKLCYPGYISACNYSLTAHKFGYSPRVAKRINPYRLGFNNDKVQTHFLPPYCCIGIMEGQKYFNSRLFKKFPDWMSRFFEMHGHNFYDIYIDTQRPNLIDINIKELASFIDVQEMTIKGDKVRWSVNVIDSWSEFEKYSSSGKKDYFVKEKIVSDIRVLSCYNTREAKPLFYHNRTNRNYDKLNAKTFDNKVEDFEEYCRLYGTELPENFYEKE